MIKELTRSVGHGERFARVLGALPRGMAREIEEIARSVPDIEGALAEVRVRRDGQSSLFMHGSSYPLFYRVGGSEMDEMLSRLTGGAAYAHKDTVSRGYIIYEGIRVGVSGLARYDGDKVGVAKIDSLVFRLGGGECSFGEELWRSWHRIGMPNMLLAAPPVGGKTTALRALAKYIGSGRDSLHVVVVDERCEFDPADYRDADVDILRGYRRSSGIELAFRTMSAEVIIADEIATRGEADALFAAWGAGVRLISSIHAASLSDLYLRDCIAPLLGAGVFGAAAVITHSGKRFSYRLEEIK